VALSLFLLFPLSRGKFGGHFIIWMVPFLLLFDLIAAFSGTRFGGRPTAVLVPSRGGENPPILKPWTVPGFEMNDDIQPPKQKTEDKGARRAGQKVKGNTNWEESGKRHTMSNIKMVAGAERSH
jgi:hypothetical protein